MTLDVEVKIGCQGLFPWASIRGKPCTKNSNTIATDSKSCKIEIYKCNLLRKLKSAWALEQDSTSGMNFTFGSVRMFHQFLKSWIPGLDHVEISIARQTLVIPTPIRLLFSGCRIVAKLRRQLPQPQRRVLSQNSMDSEWSYLISPAICNPTDTVHPIGRFTSQLGCSLLQSLHYRGVGFGLLQVTHSLRGVVVQIFW